MLVRFRHRTIEQLAIAGMDRETRTKAQRHDAGIRSRFPHNDRADEFPFSFSQLLFQLLATADNKLGPVNAEKAFASIHQSLNRKHSVVLRYGIVDCMAGLFLQFDKQLANTVLDPFHAHYPHVDLVKKSDGDFGAENDQTLVAELNLEREFFPLRSFREFEDLLDRNLNDPLAGLLNSLHSSSQTKINARIEIQLKPAGNWHYLIAHRTIKRLNNPLLWKSKWLCDWFGLWRIHRSATKRFIAWLFVALFRINSTAHPSSDMQKAIEKVNRHCFEAKIRILVSSAGSRKHAERKLQQIAGAFGQFTIGGMCKFNMCKPIRRMSWPRHRGFLLSDHEVATLFHPTTELVKSKKTSKNESRQLEPPIFLPSPKEQDVVEIGNAVFQNESQRFGISNLDRLRHCYLVGKTGTGKSSLLHRMIVDDIKKNRGVAVIDPHGDLADSILPHIPPSRTNDLVLFDATDRRHPPSWQPLSVRDELHKPIVAEELIAALKKVFDIDESNAPRMLYILRNAILALLDYPDATLLDLMEMLRDADKRQCILQHVQDDLVRRFWMIEFEKQTPRVQREWVASTQNKIGTYLSSPLTRNILGQKKGLIDLRKIMDEQKILIVNLSKGKITENNSRLLGSLLVAGIQAAAMSRADMPEDDRKFFGLYVDEFQSVASESFSSILSEARKYRLGLTISHQYVGQLILPNNNNSLRDAVFGNVGSSISFQVGQDDAEYLANYFGGDINPTDLAQLPKYHAFMKLLVDGVPKGPFSIATLPPIQPKSNSNCERVRKHSQRRYCTKVT